MLISKIELQGFKTFGKKTIFEFPTMKNRQQSLTAVVGPNGSGKSNLADAIRWVLGEQSMKTLRGKTAEDMIFAGAHGKSRSGFAEVHITFDNADGAFPIPVAEVTLTRRLFRDGQSEYLCNQTPARWNDLQILLAQARIGQRSYSIIGQGMVDHILVAAPEERKEFFDDATGVKPMQLQRHQTVLKIQRAQENLRAAQTILQELLPRFQSLKRLVHRWEQREQWRAELREKQTRIFGFLLGRIAEEAARLEKNHHDIERKHQSDRAALQVQESRFESVLREEAPPDAEEAEKQTWRLRQELRAAHQEFFTAKLVAETHRSRAVPSPLPMSPESLRADLDTIISDHDTFLAHLKKPKASGPGLLLLAKKIRMGLAALRKKFVPDSPDRDVLFPASKRLHAAEHNVKEKEKALQQTEEHLRQLQNQSRQNRSVLWDLQKTLRDLHGTITQEEKISQELSLALARLQERREHLREEIGLALREGAETVLAADPLTFPRLSSKEQADLEQEIRRRVARLELVGGVDDETVQEFQETGARKEFLETQSRDLYRALEDLQAVLRDLDKKILHQSEKKFREIQQAFQRYFHLLFDGGSCRLVRLTRSESQKPSSEFEAFLPSAPTEGIDIEATPPGKKLSSLALLSGGERALTAIALLSAILSTHPSPFVVLDEVDAALDESNTGRFAAILQELKTRSQFIVITHNRATMEAADTLYGVTMGEDGTSHVLSLNFSDVLPEVKTS